jgi:hypothetical protein
MLVVGLISLFSASDFGMSSFHWDVLRTWK